jgi:hypothetical protein
VTSPLHGAAEGTGLSPGVLEVIYPRYVITRLRPTRTTVIVVAAIAVLGMPEASANAAPSKAAGLLAASLTAATSEPGGQWQETNTQNGTTIVVSVEAGKADGEETAVLRSVRHLGHLQLRLTNSVLYLEGDDFGLQAADFTDTARRSEAGKWISLRPSVPSQTTLYRGLSHALTVESMISGLGMTGPLAQTAPGTIDGTGVVGVKGTPASLEAQTEILYMRASGMPLPVRVVLLLFGGPTATIEFSHWGDVPIVTKPVSSVPFQPGWVTNS